MKQVKRTFLVLMILLPVFLLRTFAATPLYTDPDTGYSVYIDDRENLLTEEEEGDVLLYMQDITPYGGAAFVTASYENAESVYRSYFGTDSGTLLLIDMGSRQITVFSDGGIYRTVNKKYANIITDNVYSYASEGDYAGCAMQAFWQIGILLEGGRIAQPMRYITNALTAIALAMILNFVYLWYRKKRLSGKDIMNAVLILGTAAGGVWAGNRISRNLVSSKKRRRSEGGSGGGSGGGGGGGGSSGGGGSHSF